MTYRRPKLALITFATSFTTAVDNYSRLLFCGILSVLEFLYSTVLQGKVSTLIEADLVVSHYFVDVASQKLRQT